MNLKKHCEICGREYDAYKSDQRYCENCKDEGNRRKRRVKFELPPVEPTTFVRKRISRQPDGSKIAIISDIHYPFHDERTVYAVFKFIDDFKPDIIVWNGDTGDFYNISSFDKNPKRTFRFEDELLGIREDLLVPCAKSWSWAVQYWAFGNHEERLRVYLAKHPELAGLVNLDKILGLSELGFQVLPYGGVLDYLGFAITHGTRYSSLPNGTARIHAQMIGGSGVVGHSHRIGQWTYTNLRGAHTFFESGCLCRLDPDWVSQRPPNWQQGFLAGVAQGNKVHLHPMVIYEEGFYGAFTGRLYKR
jgi:hypothetical protein